MKVLFRPVILVSLLLPLGSVAGPLDGALIYNRKTCATCHGVDGKVPTMTVYPRVDGQSADYAYAQMVDIRAGRATTLRVRSCARS